MKVLGKVILFLAVIIGFSHCKTEESLVVPSTEIELRIVNSEEELLDGVEVFVFNSKTDYDAAIGKTGDAVLNAVILERHNLVL